MIRILGIDPGSRVTGYGVIDIDINRTQYVASGCIRLTKGSIPERLEQIFTHVLEVVSTYQPQHLAIEKVFVHKNVDSALKLGQARGAAICACVNRAMPVSEYTPREIKQAIVGKGAASKHQVQHMIQSILSLSDHPAEDAADALAVAICHGHSHMSVARFSGTWQSPARRTR